MFKLVLLPLRVFIKGIFLGGCGCIGLIIGVVAALIIGLVLVFWLIT